MIIHIYTRSARPEGHTAQMKAAKSWIEEQGAEYAPGCTYSDTCGGTEPFEKRPEGAKLLARLAKGDMVLTMGPSRISRVMDNFTAIQTLIYSRGAYLRYASAEATPAEPSEAYTALYEAQADDRKRLEMFPELVEALTVVEAVCDGLPATNGVVILVRATLDKVKAADL